MGYSTKIKSRKVVCCMLSGQGPLGLTKNALVHTWELNVQEKITIICFMNKYLLKKIVGHHIFGHLLLANSDKVTYTEVVGLVPVVFVLFPSRWSFLYFYCPWSKSKFYLMFSILSASYRNPGKQNYCSIFILYDFSKRISKFYFFQFCPISFVKNISEKVCDYQQNISTWFLCTNERYQNWNI